jgi:hypothetical protein
VKLRSDWHARRFSADRVVLLPQPQFPDSATPWWGWDLQSMSPEKTKLVAASTREKIIYAEWTKLWDVGRREVSSMPRKPANSGKSWTGGDVAKLKKEIRQNTPTRVMGIHLKRTPGAVQQKARELGLSTKPTNQSPYGTRKKR